MEQVTFPVRVLAEFGIQDLLLTNAAGGINRRFRKGDFMVLTDHINFMGTNPLRGAAIPDLPRFVDLTETYDKKLRGLLFRAGKISKLKLQRGVYLAVSGPSYETPAEIRAFATLTPCTANGGSCTSGIDCCGGYCVNGVCQPSTPECSKVDDKCRTNADCCPAAEPLLCLGGFCSTPPIVK